MIYSCGDLRLDDQLFELTRSGQPVSVEPQVFLVLRELLRAQGRLVSKDDLVETVWHGRAITDACIASRMRAARNAVGDDGKSQTIIRTIHGRGFRLLPPVRVSDDTTPAAHPRITQAAEAPDPEGQPSIAVLPFRAVELDGANAILAEAVAHEILRALARMRWLTVISRGSSFRFSGTSPDLGMIGRTLAVRYILVGTLELSGRILSVSVELVEAATGKLIWTDRLARPIDLLAELQYAIVTSVATALEVTVPLHEAQLAEGKDLSQLDAWANYHLGLRQMFLFSPEGNQRAAKFFERSIRQDPKFARAHAGLSFTSFQEAFLRYGLDRGEAVNRARAQAERSVELDPMDPFAALTLGRSYWLTDELDLAAGWLARATDLNPNYAQGFYSRALTDVIMLEADIAADEVNKALRLSPLDPLLYGMFGTRAMSYLLRAEYAEAADWADRAASAPHAHFLIGMIAMVANGLAERNERAQEWLRHTRSLRPDVNAELFFAAFPFRDQGKKDLLRRELARFGIR
ncbi:winged helix-turn-helix domain-containing protein [Paracoccus sp. MBLB3053]|uniref:Winged helix-turn-helix domain-containing protein n=1 Tax=Paracoccus aurantius TaxID=3073814 RepID=A0ABU2HW63_9RHOB|nr:winged helix-turn-helix domain-containing protein [Paracoccus sp. MBLB3053]MDS9469287.1 winged helix-turn-helix domain-containing protein [Paracoccus sp. MBLB3053]